ncbi:MAG: PEP-CTERM system histidine kinase PrsK, partial [Gammaproteobacteria bacterium]|nr:PEP-CTERM system histidine kinase PrsK [Gammaproteobacteria bacterium]
GHPQISRKINWEDRDLLKVVTDQVASYLALVTMTEELDRAHQFDAFNRLSAYVVHDLKNLIAQLGLVVANAEKHRHNPAFLDDVVTTVENAVAKMDRLLAQLRKDRFEKSAKIKITINKEIGESVQNMSSMKPIPVFTDCNEPITMDIDGDRLSAVVEHLIRNAQEATDEEGHIEVSLKKRDNLAIIEISDTGHGMDKSFIQNRLFKPFDTTKGNAGMGIGVYETRQFVQQLGGKIKVKSQPGEGTQFLIELPI